MNKDIALYYSNVATDSMLQAAHEIKGDGEEPICDIAVLCDGTLQTGLFFSQWDCHR